MFIPKSQYIVKPAELPGIQRCINIKMQGRQGVQNAKRLLLQKLIKVKKQVKKQNAKSVQKQANDQVL